MNKKTWAIILFFVAASQWYFPQWDGLFWDSADVSMGEGRIVASILFVSGLFLWFSDSKEEKEGIVV